MDIVWTEQLSIGNAVIDSDHRNLIEITNHIVHAIRTRNYHALVELFGIFGHKLCVHFANEEKLAQAVNFDFTEHKLAQHYELKKLQFLRGELIAENCLWTDSQLVHFSRFLKNWMVEEHIIGSGMRMKPVLQEYNYSFWPNRECDELDGHLSLSIQPGSLNRSLVDSLGCL